MEHFILELVDFDSHKYIVDETTNRISHERLSLELQESAGHFGNACIGFMIPLEKLGLTKKDILDACELDLSEENLLFKDKLYVVKHYFPFEKKITPDWYLVIKKEGWLLKNMLKIHFGNSLASVPDTITVTITDDEVVTLMNIIVYYEINKTILLLND